MLEPPRTSAYCTLHTLYPLKRCSWRRFDARTHVKELYTPCYLCHDVVREGLMRVNHPEQGYRLMEAQYIQNMWLNIHQPSFAKQLREASKIFWEGVDKDNKGYLITEEAKKIGFKLTKDGEKRGIFEALDKENTGQITFEDSIKTQNFFFTDQENEDHPFTFVRGPLVED